MYLTQLNRVVSMLDETVPPMNQLNRQNPIIKFEWHATCFGRRIEKAETRLLGRLRESRGRISAFVVLRV